MAHDLHGNLTALLPRLAAFARTILGDADTACDLVQEAATRALAARQVPQDAPGVDKVAASLFVRNRVRASCNQRRCLRAGARRRVSVVCATGLAAQEAGFARRARRNASASDDAGLESRTMRSSRQATL